MDVLFEISSYLRHAWKAKGPHGVHSPFVYQLITDTLRHRNKPAFFSTIEDERRALLNNESSIVGNDFGAGSRLGKPGQRTVRQIARTSLQSKKCARIFYRLVEHFQPMQILELGTSLGITTSYLATANPDSQVFTVEGSRPVADIAQKTFDNLHLSNINLVHGRFDDVLIDLLKQMETVDFVLMDGNHRYAPTKHYFLQMLPYFTEKCIVVMDDIHWSPGMEHAWNDIHQIEAVTLSIDFFHFGLLFFNEGREKEHFVLRLP